MARTYRMDKTQPDQFFLGLVGHVLYPRQHALVGDIPVTGQCDHQALGQFPDKYLLGLVHANDIFQPLLLGFDPGGFGGTEYHGIMAENISGLAGSLDGISCDDEAALGYDRDALDLLVLPELSIDYLVKNILDRFRSLQSYTSENPLDLSQSDSISHFHLICFRHFYVL